MNINSDPFRHDRLDVGQTQTNQAPHNPEQYCRVLHVLQTLSESPLAPELRCGEDLRRNAMNLHD